jgi:ATP-dependent Clp protease adapter protein ClpS
MELFRKMKACNGLLGFCSWYTDIGKLDSTLRQRRERLRCRVRRAVVAGAAASSLDGSRTHARGTPGHRLVQGQMPAPKIGRPKTEVKRETFRMPEPVKEVEAEAGAVRGRPKTKRVTDTEFVPMWKVILLGDKEYEEKHVIESLVKTIPKMDKEEARRIFKEAQAVGESVVTVVAQEHAEFYATMLRRCSLYVRIEPE